MSYNVSIVRYIMKKVLADKIILARPATKERFTSFVGQGRTADRALNDLLDKMGVPR